MIIFLAAFILLLCISAPITVALGGCSLVYALVGGTVPITTLIQTTFGGMTSFPLLAIPLFMLAGNLMIEEAGGRVSRYDGSALALGPDEIAASNGRLHPRLLAALNEE